MASPLNRDTLITAISPTNTSAIRTYRTRIRVSQRGFEQHAIKTPLNGFQGARCSYRGCGVATMRETDLTPSRTSVRGLQASQQFFYKRKATKSGSAHQFTFCAFCFFLLPISYLSLTLLLKLLYFVIIIIYTQ